METICVPKVTKPSWMGGAYTIAFIYSNKGNFILKGFYSDINHYLDNSHLKWFGNFVLFRNGRQRNMWKHSMEYIYINAPSFRKSTRSGKKKYHFTIMNFSARSEQKYKYLKRLPKRYIPELFE